MPLEQIPDMGIWPQHVCPGQGGAVSWLSPPKMIVRRYGNVLCGHKLCKQARFYVGPFRSDREESSDALWAQVQSDEEAQGAWGCWRVIPSPASGGKVKNIL